MYLISSCLLPSDKKLIITVMWSMYLSCICVSVCFTQVHFGSEQRARSRLCRESGEHCSGGWIWPFAREEEWRHPRCFHTTEEVKVVHLLCSHWQQLYLHNMQQNDSQDLTDRIYFSFVRKLTSLSDSFLVVVAVNFSRIIIRFPIWMTLLLEKCYV